MVKSIKELNINDKVRIGKSKDSKLWKVVGFDIPLPFMGGDNVVIIFSGKRSKRIKLYKIKKI